MKRNVQVSYDLFVALIKFHLFQDDDYADEIQTGLEQKLDALVRHELYAKYKTAPTEEEREKARQEYLDIENGIAPACRALIAPIEMATGKQAYFCGKPNPLMMRTGLKLLGCHSEDAVIIGDRMDTDIIAGTESGVDTVLVLSGVSDRETPKTYAYQPTVILDGVGCISNK